MSREKSIANYYMRVRDFVFDPIRISGTFYIKVAYVKNPKFKSLHLAKDLSLVSTSMPNELINSYTPVLLRNANGLYMGVE